jgi:hypothetical protein
MKQIRLLPLILALLMFALLALGGCKTAPAANPQAQEACKTAGKATADACKACCAAAGASGHMWSTDSCKCM